MGRLDDIAARNQQAMRGDHVLVKAVDKERDQQRALHGS